MEMREGGCFCKSVRYRLLDSPLFVHCCHCTNCRSQTGSAFVINALIEAAKVQMLCGELDVVPMAPEGERPHDIHRCRTCRVAVWSDYGRRGFRFVRVGTLDRPEELPPDVHIYTRSKLPWVALPEGVPAFEAYYDVERLWPASSLARRNAVVKG